MNYEKLYNNIIKNRRRFPLNRGEYGEHHHITPSALGGSDEPGNIVKLTAREHFLCHYLLVKMQIPDTIEWIKMYHAFNMFHSPKLKYINSRLYSRLKIEASMQFSKHYSGKNSSIFGKKVFNNGLRNIYLKEDDVIPEGFAKGSVVKYYWITNGNINIKHEKGGYLPNGFYYGRTMERGKYKWITNGNKNTRIPVDKNIPEGFWDGSSIKSTAEKMWINDGTNSIFLDCNKNIPDGYVIGRLRSPTENKIWYTNGKDNKMISLDDNIPGGYTKGRTIKKSTYSRYTNGLDNITVREGGNIPEGFYKGVTRNRLVIL